MLRRVLADWAPQVPWEALDIAPTARAEDISVDRYIRLSDALVEAGVLQGG
jgi:16S rRNA (adenine1518-N6/adenine1519-N6)-dimethyltransferase